MGWADGSGIVWADGSGIGPELPGRCEMDFATMHSMLPQVPHQYFPEEKVQLQRRTPEVKTPIGPERTTRKMDV